MLRATPCDVGCRSYHLLRCSSNRHRAMAALENGERSLRVGCRRPSPGAAMRRCRATPGQFRSFASTPIWSCQRQLGYKQRTFAPTVLSILSAAADIRGGLQTADDASTVGQGRDAKSSSSSTNHVIRRNTGSPISERADEKSFEVNVKRVGASHARNS